MSNSNNNADYFDFENVFDSNFLDQITSDLIKDAFETATKTKNSVTSLTGRILNYIHEKIENGQHEIKYSKFHDHLISIGCDAEDVNEGFEFLDFSYDDFLILEELNNYLGSAELKTKRFPIELYLKKLRLTSLLPGFIDAYVDDSLPHSYELLHQKLFKFLLSHRLPSNLINPKKIVHQMNNLNLRRKFLLMQEDKYEQSDVISNQMIFKTEQCVKLVTTCCSPQKTSNLLNNQMNTYWESKNSDCDPHWILIQLKENITPLKLYLTFHLTKDDSFKAQFIEISVSEDAANKRFNLISTCKIQTSASTSIMLESESTVSDSASSVTSAASANLNANQSNNGSSSATNSQFSTGPNEFLLCDSFPKNQNYSYIRINIKATNSHAIRVKSIRLLGVKRESNKQQTVKDASICWFFDLLSSMALMQTQVMPGMLTNLLSISKNALSNMPPLSLSVNDNNSEGFLSEAVLVKVDGFLKSLINFPHHTKQECSQAVLVYLEFNLARGYLKNILYSLNWILENSQLNYDFRELIPKLDTVSETCVRKTADHLKLTIIHSDGMPSEKNAIKPNFLLENNTNQQIYMTDSSVKRFNLILKSDKFVTITSLFMKIQRGNVGVKNFLLFFILNDEEPNINDFSKFNNFTKNDYDTYKNQQNHEEDKNFKMVYFEFLDKQTEAEFELPLVYRVKYIFIKFLRPKDSNAERIGIMHLKFNGCTYDNVDIYNQFSVIKYASSLNPHSGAMLVCAILWFLCQLAEKHKTLSRMQREPPPFINFDEFQINELWKLYETILNEYSKQQQHPNKLNNKIQTLRIPILCLLYELVNCAEIKSLNYTFDLNQKVLDYLINLINSENNEHNDSDDELQHITIISKHILLNGIDVFFPTFELRKQCLMLMLDLNSPSTETSAITQQSLISTNFNDYLGNIANKKSSNLLFEAFCTLFYNAKASLLIDLSIKNLLNYSLNDAESTKKMLENFNLISKIIELSLNPNSKEVSNERYTIINKLLNKIQSYICYKCRKLLVYLANPNEQQCFGDAIDQEFIKEFDLANNLKLKKRLKHSIELFLANYTKLLINKIYLFLNKSDNLSLVSYLQTETFLILTLHHYILWLIELVTMFSIKTCTVMLGLILDIEKLLNKINFIESINSEASPSDNTSTASENTDENVLKVWYIDTKTYSTLNNLNIDFNCIGATRYHIVFDDLCEIKNNIDLFEFIDSDNEHYTCNGYKVGCDTWKKELNINSQNYLEFNLITHKTIVPLEENINIKFTCKAYGYGNRTVDNQQSTVNTKSTSNSINDLRTSITCLIGIYCSHIYTQRLSKFVSTSKSKPQGAVAVKQGEEKPAVNEEDEKKSEISSKYDNNEVDGDNEAAATAATTETKQPEVTASKEDETEETKIENYYYFDLNCYLYKTLLRGGLIEVNCNANKLIRSYSGIHESIGMNDKMHRFLINLIENPQNTEFMKLYENHVEKIKRPKIGGVRVNKAIVSIFAALIWHTPVIKRNDLIEDEDNDDLESTAEITKVINDHVAQAYRAAEAVRMIIIEQQQLSKLTEAENSEHKTDNDDDSDDEDENYEDFIDMVTKKANYLLKISRLSKIPMKNELYNDYEDIDKCNLVSKSRIKKNHHHHHHANKQQQQQQHSSSTSSSATPSVKLPKSDAYPTFNLILEFIFDKLVNLKLITKILNLKKQNAKSISEAFKISKEYIDLTIDEQIPQQQKTQQQQLECVLTFLSCFFNQKSQKYGIHYLQNLYGCGLNLEKLVREAYYDFLKLIFNFIKKYQMKHEDGSITAYELDTYIRLNSYLLHFFNIDWELYDWRFILEINLDKFLIKSCYLNLPLNKHEYDPSDSNSKKPMEILESIFDVNADQAKATPTSTTDDSPKAVVTENDDENSFDLKIYPKLYKQYFGVSSANVANKRFNTEELIECLEREAVNPEQKIKFHIARYMAWKYFYKLKVNFTCDICDILLVAIVINASTVQISPCVSRVSQNPALTSTQATRK